MPILWPAQAGTWSDHFGWYSTSSSMKNTQLSVTGNLKFLSYNSYVDKVHMYL